MERCANQLWLRTLLAADLERELLSLKREEARLITEIKKAARDGNQASTRILAKSLVRVRGQQTKIHAGIAQMQGVKSGMTVSPVLTLCRSCATCCCCCCCSDSSAVCRLQLRQPLWGRAWHTPQRPWRPWARCACLHVAAGAGHSCSPWS